MAWDFQRCKKLPEKADWGRSPKRSRFLPLEVLEFAFLWTTWFLILLLIHLQLGCFNTTQMGVRNPRATLLRLLNKPDWKYQEFSLTDTDVKILLIHSQGKRDTSRSEKWNLKTRNRLGYLDRLHWLISFKIQKKLTHTTRLYCNLEGINEGGRHFNIILMQYNDYSMIKG